MGVVGRCGRFKCTCVYEMPAKKKGADAPSKKTIEKKKDKVIEVRVEYCISECVVFWPCLDRIRRLD